MKKKDLLNIKTYLISTALGISVLASPITSQAKNSTNIETQKVKGTDYYIDHYSDVFGLNSDVVHDKIYDICDNFNTQNYAWTYGNSINGQSYKSKKIAIMDTVYKIWCNPENFEFTDEELNKLYDSNDYDEDVKAEELIAEYADAYDVNKEVALAIAYYETGYMTSGGYMIDNNPAGIGPHNCYPSKEAGIINYCNVLRNIGCTRTSGDGFLDAIKDSYCAPVYDENGNKINTWYNSVSYIHSCLCYDYLYRIPEDEKKNYNIPGYKSPEEKDEAKAYELKNA